jgi:hypothetical protein
MELFGEIKGQPWFSVFIIFAANLFNYGSKIGEFFQENGSYASLAGRDHHHGAYSYSP